MTRRTDIDRLRLNLGRHISQSELYLSQRERAAELYGITWMLLGA